MVLFYTNTPEDFVFHYGSEPVLFSTKGLNPFCFTLWVFFRHVLHYGSIRHVLHYGVGVGRADSYPFGIRHGMGT